MGGGGRRGHGADCLPASSFEAKNERSYTSASRLCLHAMYWEDCTFFTELMFPVILVSSQFVYLLLQYVFLYSGPVIVHCSLFQFHMQEDMLITQVY
jgi:hypothetical protein